MARRLSTAKIKALYAKEKILRSPAFPSTLKVTMMAGRAGRGGYTLLAERGRRRVPRQMKGTSSTRKIRALED